MHPLYHNICNRPRQLVYKYGAAIRGNSTCTDNNRTEWRQGMVNIDWGVTEKEEEEEEEQPESKTQKIVSMSGVKKMG